MNRPTKEICRQACIPSSKVASVLHPETPRGASRSWHMLAMGACLFFATSCDTHSEVNWEGIRAHEVERARQQFHVDGSGVKVCVLSDSTRYLGETKSITHRDVKIIQDPTGASQSGIQKDDDEHSGKDKKDEGEGTAMLEIVHSIAPGAQLMFATQGPDPEQMAYNIRAFGNIGCKIIVDDAEFWNQSPFQDDKIAKAVNEVTGDGALYITSAGNQGEQSHVGGLGRLV